MTDQSFLDRLVEDAVSSCVHAAKAGLLPWAYARRRKAWVDVLGEEPHKTNAQAYADWLEAARTIYGLGGVILRMAPRPQPAQHREAA